MQKICVKTNIVSFRILSVLTTWIPVAIETWDILTKNGVLSFFLKECDFRVITQEKNMRKIVSFTSSRFCKIQPAEPASRCLYLPSQPPMTVGFALAANRLSAGRRSGLEKTLLEIFSNFSKLNSNFFNFSKKYFSENCEKLLKKSQFQFFCLKKKTRGLRQTRTGRIKT